MVCYLNLPGIGNSGKAHWHTKWEATDDRFSRFSPESWDLPDLRHWTHALEAALKLAQNPTVLVAHSLACLLVAHAATNIRAKVAGAFLVAVPNPDGSKFPRQAPTFQNPPTTALPFPSLMLASKNDPYGTFEYSQVRAAQWGSTLIDLGELGHVNGESNLADWQNGKNLLRAFSTGLGLKG